MLTLPSLSPGSHSVGAQYNGDANFTSSNSSGAGGSGGVNQTIGKASTTTSLSSSTNPSMLKQSVTFTASVSVVAPGSGTPTETVTFRDGANILGTATLGAPGTATFTTSSLAVASHSISASYSGDSSFNGSGGNITQQVTYAICALYDQTRSVKAGAPFPIKVELCDINGADVSAPAFVLHAVQITNVSGFSGAPETVGNANPDNDFRFDSTLGTTGGYIFNLSTSGLASGTVSTRRMILSRIR
jgi:Bacterial Ig-like domain (group 3)